MSQAAVLAGVDGCPKGWICLTRDSETRAITSRVFPSAKALYAQEPAPRVLCIDIPIGLTDSGARQADVAARACLGSKRASSVFPSPIRPALEGRDYADATARHKAGDGRGISKQAFAIYPKIREVDRELQLDAALAERVREVHPEVCFWAWNHGVPLEHGKKTMEGQQIRRELIAKTFGPEAFAKVRAAHPRSEASDDDITDAFAALRTAMRIDSGESQTLPSRVPRDRFGLRMEMCY
ncbi:MAG: DUF429 domain-containing protein [Phycisphaerales bacterium]|nr:DUF429 domain-containing protein [Phycisphaerales bacterium]